jgi:hypothetical protein
MRFAADGVDLDRPAATLLHDPDLLPLAAHCLVVGALGVVQTLSEAPGAPSLGARSTPWRAEARIWCRWHYRRRSNHADGLTCRDRT